MKRERTALAILFASFCLFCAGCAGGGVDASYGKARGKSINGVSGFAELCRGRGHSVRVSVRLNDRVGDWASTIVRFSPYPGPPEKSEADWYQQWAARNPNRRVLYVPRDFDSEPEFWSTILASHSKKLTDRYIADATTQRNNALKWSDELPNSARNPAPPADWYRNATTTPPPTVCKTLDGPWAEGVDSAKAAITRHQVPEVEHDEEVLLRGDGQPLVLNWAWNDGGRVLVVANGSFLLNETLAHRERRKLTEHVLDWLADGGPNIAFIEGRATTEDKDCPLSGTIWEIFCVEPVNRVLAQWLVFSLLLVLSLAPILGRPRTWSSEGDDRPVAHAEALGDLLGRVKDESSARAMLDTYRRWRNPGGPPAP
jgi:hypothetical protein